MLKVVNFKNCKEIISSINSELWKIKMWVFYNHRTFLSSEIYSKSNDIEDLW